MKNILIFFCALLFSLSVYGEETQEKDQDSSVKKEIEALKKEIKELNIFKEKQELEALRNEAEKAADKTDESESLDTTKTFSSGQTAQQALNPEISVVGDFFGKVRFSDPHSRDKDRTGAFFRVAGLHLQSDLDPFSKTFIAVGISPSEIKLGEAFIDWNGLIPSLTIRVGKFLQNFGVINRWHMPSLDQFDNPLAPSELLGGKLNQTGVSLHWIMPAMWATSNELIIEITNPQNPHLFAGEYFTPIPSTLARLINYWDVTESLYINLGFSGIYGPNSKYMDDSGQSETRKYSLAGGADLTVLFEPAKTARHKSLLWRSEFYFVNKELKDGDKIQALGFYSYLEGKLTRQWNIGTRFDFTQPFEKNNSDHYTYQIVPYVTFFQSPWVKLRAQYNLKNGADMDEFDHSAVVQLIWSAGPHKHERY